MGSLSVNLLGHMDMRVLAGSQHTINKVIDKINKSGARQVGSRK